MADSAISGLTAAGTLTGTEIFHGEQSSNSRKLTTQAVADLSSTKGAHAVPFVAGSLIIEETAGPELETSETSTHVVMVEGLLFDDTAEEGAQFTFPTPTSWDGSTITAQFIWSHPATTTNFGVAWTVEARSFANDEALDAAFGTAVAVTDTGGITDKQYTTAATGNITVAGTPAGGELLIVRIARDPANGSDDMAVDAKLIGGFIFLTTDAETDA